MRERLPNRRPHIVVKLDHKGTHYHVGYGCDATGAMREVFADARHVGTDMQALLSDTCILISLLAQHGMTFEEIAGALHENCPEGSSESAPASVVGQILLSGVVLECG